MLIPETVSVIAFDAVGTVIYPDPSVAVAYAQIGQKHGSKFTEGEVKQRFRDAYSKSEAGDEFLDPPWSTSEAYEEQRWRSLVEIVLPDVTNFEACFEELYAHFAKPKHWRCFEDVLDTLAYLKAVGYRLAIASNFDRRLNALCDHLPGLELLDVRVISSEVGYRKPSPKFYEKLVKACESETETTLMVGDDLTNDVHAAIAAGLPVLHLNRGDSVDAEVPSITCLQALQHQNC